jgi:DNA polymerase-3 subunit alpha
MGGVESLGLLKMDFLGLRNLSVIETTLDLLRQSGVELDIDAIPLDDEATLAMLRKGDSIGVFQLEGGPMRSLMRALAPTSFDDVAALVALYRPGPMAANMHLDYADRKNGRKPVTCLHPELEQLLADTYGLMIYQESVMRVAQRIAGFSLPEADDLRKACAKKKRELIAEQREKFVAGCERTGYGKVLGNALFDVIEPFADYAFPKSHAYGYGYVAFQTAYLKAHHPVEYLAALLTSVKDNQDRSAVYLNECRALGIKVLVPDVNRSMSDFTAGRDDDGTGVIPFGLSAVRNVGEGLVSLIIAEREQGGPFTDFWDFCNRVDPGVLNKRTMESLIKAGAFDALGHERRGLLAVFETIVDRTLSRRRKEAEGQFDLFSSGGGDEGGGVEERIIIPDLAFDKAQRLAYEKEMLGLYVSDHPLMGSEHRLRSLTDGTIAELREAGGTAGGVGEARTVAGVVTNLQRKTTKRGDLMAVFVLEDLEAAIEVMVFPKTMLEHGTKLIEDAVVCVKGRLDTREDAPKLVCLEVTCVELAAAGIVPLRLAVPPHRVDERCVEELKRMLVEHPGDSPVFLKLGTTELRLPPTFNVDTTNGLLGELRVLLGPACIQG